MSLRPTCMCNCTQLSSKECALVPLWIALISFTETRSFERCNIPAHIDIDCLDGNTDSPTGIFPAHVYSPVLLLVSVCTQSRRLTNVHIELTRHLVFFFDSEA